MSRIHYTRCPVCNSGQIQPVFKVTDYTTSKEQFEIVSCNHCLLRFTQDVPDQEHIGPYYKSEDYISHTNSNRGMINALYQKVRRHTMKRKAGLIKKQTGLQTGSLLDVGCGTGTFLYTMQQQGWKVLGLEPDAGARKIAQDMYKVSTVPSQEIFELQDSYDAITLWHVLEHVHSLHEYVRQLKKLLKPGGKLFIAVPNYTSKDAAVYGPYWAAYDVPRHLYHFSPQSMDVLLGGYGLKVTARLPMWFDSFYVSLLSTRYKNGRPDFLAAGWQGLMSNIRAWRHVQKCSSVIYVAE